jgi:formyl-CoA transferase
MSGDLLPLADLRVLEAGQLLAGPFCGQLLGDFGAEVIKIEDPGKGDPMRQWGRVKPEGFSLWWPIVARNKKSITCDLRVGRGQEILRNLIQHTDIFVENFRPGTLERWGLGYDELSKINPKLILVRVSGFGQDGPYSTHAGFGSIGEAMGGVRHITGEPDKPPARIGISLGDALAGTFATLGALVAVHARKNSGRGQIVDCAIYEAVLALMESVIPEWDIANLERGRTGAILPNVAPSNVYESADDETILIAANQDSVFRRLASVMERVDLATDERFISHDARGSNQGELDVIIGSWTREHTANKILELLNAAGVPAGRIYKAKDMLADLHFKAREAIVRLTHPVLGEFPMQNVVPKLSETPGRVRWLGPNLGEHNKEVYGDLLHFSDSELAELVEDGVV